MASLIINSHQVPDHAIMDINGKQTYLGNSYIVSSPSAAAGGTGEVNVISITNPSTSGKSLMISRRVVSTALATAASVIFRSYLNPTGVAAGTDLTPTPLRVNAATPASAMTSKIAPTTTGSGTLMDTVLATTSSGPADMDFLIILDPGKSMLITAQATDATALIASQIVYYELPTTTTL